jgi:hypothetical protein
MAGSFMKTPSLSFALVFCLSCLAVVAAPAASPVVPSTEASEAVRATTRKAVTLAHEKTFTLPGTPGQVFALLCPVREYDWLPNWKGEMISSASGFAEENCLFRTRSMEGGKPVEMLWICTRYEAPTLVEYTCVANERSVFRLRINLAPAQEGTRVIWGRTWISLGPVGDEWARTVRQADLDNQIEWLRKEMDHYLRTGRMLTDIRK